MTPKVNKKIYLLVIVVEEFRNAAYARIYLFTEG